MASAEVQTPRPESQQTIASVQSYRSNEPPTTTNTNSLVTVRLSEPDSATLSLPSEQSQTGSTLSDRTVEPFQRLGLRRVDTTDSISGAVPTLTEEGPDIGAGAASWRGSVRESTKSQRTDDFPVFQEEDVFDNASTEDQRTRSNSNSSRTSHDSGAVDWSELEKTEEDEARDEVSDEVHICRPDT